MTLFEQALRQHGECCSCRIPLSETDHIWFMTLNKLATWKKPVASNNHAEDKRPRAIAIICNKCFEENHKPSWAMEFRRNVTDIVYHNVYNLDNLPPLFPIAKLDEHGRIKCPKCNTDIIPLDKEVFNKGLNRCPVCKVVFEIMDDLVNAQGRNPNPI